MKLIKWVNTFHKTQAYSTLTYSRYEDIGYQIISGYMGSSHKDYRKVKALENKLCPHKLKDCSCEAAMIEVKE